MASDNKKIKTPLLKMKPHRGIRALAAQSHPRLTEAYRDNWNVIFAKKKKR
jgi:hypothetical protein